VVVSPGRLEREVQVSKGDWCVSLELSYSQGVVTDIFGCVVPKLLLRKELNLGARCSIA